MRRLLTVALAFLLLPAAPALGANYLVTGTADVTGTPCTPGANGFLTCTSLRQAVNEANASGDAQDAIVLSQGTYTLTQGELLLTGGIGIAGPGARGTVISGNHASRVIRVAADAQTNVVAGVTLAAGSVTGDGGNVLNEGQLSLSQVAITDGNANNGSGGGIANNGGQLLVLQSLIASNDATFTGGGISNALRGPTTATLAVNDSTFTGNDGSTGNAIGTGGSGNTVLSSTLGS